MKFGLLNAVPSTIAMVACSSGAIIPTRLAIGLGTWIPLLASGDRVVLAGVAGSVTSVVAAWTLVNIGISSANPPLWSMSTAFLSGSTAAAGIAIINSIDNWGDFAGPSILTGYNHLLIVVALVLDAATLWNLMKVVTAFTLAHSTRSFSPDTLEPGNAGNKSRFDKSEVRRLRCCSKDMICAGG